jgi:hypothetical protein
VTWGNAPATVGNAVNVSSGAGWRDWNVSSHVQAMYDSAEHNGWLIRDANENQDSEQQFHSREKSSERPELVVKFGPASAPPPAPSDTTPPETTITSGPPATTQDTSASFRFSASEAGSSFQCSLDAAAFTACTSPRDYTGLAVGPHQFRVRASDPAGNTDPTPASHSWTIEAPSGCPAQTTAVAIADSWIDQNSPSNNKGTDSILKVQSKRPADNFRALVRFVLPTDVPEGCVVASATLRLYSASAQTGRTLNALRIDAGWSENLVTWSNQPQTTGTAATTVSGNGYREWNVTSHVQAMYDGAANHGFLIRDAAENADAEQQFHSREKGENPPQLVLRFAVAGAS